MEHKNPRQNNNKRKSEQLQAESKLNRPMVDWNNIPSPNPRYKGMTVKDLAKRFHRHCGGLDLYPQ